MEQNTNNEELDMEYRFALGEGDFAPIKARGCTNFAESSNKTMESTGWTGDNKCLDAIVEGDAQLEVVKKIFVGCSNMAIQILEI